MKFDYILWIILVLMFKFLTVTKSIQVFENTATNNSNETLPSTKNVTKLDPMLANMNSKGPVLYPKQVIPKIKNVSAGIKTTDKVDKPKKHRQSHEESQQSIQQVSAQPSKKKEFIPSPEVKLSPEEIQNEMRQGETFQPSGLMMPYNPPAAAATVIPLQTHQQKAKSFTPNPYYNHDKQDHHQVPNPKDQFQKQHNQVDSTSSSQSSPSSADNIIYGKHHLANSNNNHQLEVIGIQKSNEQTSRNNLINWPSEKKLLENFEQKQSISASGWNENQPNSHQHFQVVSSSITFDPPDHHLPEIKIMNHGNRQQLSQQTDHHKFPAPNLLDHQQNGHLTLLSGGSSSGGFVVPTSSEHPYQFEIVSDKDSEYFQENHSNRNIHGDQYHSHNNPSHHQHHFSVDGENVNQFLAHPQINVIQDENPKHYESDLVSSNEDGLISTIGESSGNFEYQNQHNYGVHDHTKHYPKNLQKNFHWKKIASILASIIPIGLLFSALTPNVVVINPNATALTRSPAQSTFTLFKPNRQRSLDAQQPLPPPPPSSQQQQKQLQKLNSKGIHLKSKNLTRNSKCIERSICELAATIENSKMLKMLLEELQRNYRNKVLTEPTQFTEEELLLASKGENCRSYDCDEFPNE